MTRSRVLFALTLTGAMLAALSALAQSNGSFQGKDQAANEGGTDDSDRETYSDKGFGLLRNPEVQNDLRLTDEQRVEVLALGMEMRRARVDMKKKLAEILRPKQIQRLKEIRLQVEGPAVINSNETAKALGLTREQRAKLKDLQSQVRAEVEGIFREARALTTDEQRATMPEIVQRLQHIRAKMNEKCQEILTPEQRETLDKLQGKKLNLIPPASQPSAQPVVP